MRKAAAIRHIRRFLHFCIRAFLLSCILRIPLVSHVSNATSVSSFKRVPQFQWLGLAHRGRFQLILLGFRVLADQSLDVLVLLSLVIVLMVTSQLDMCNFLARTVACFCFFCKVKYY